MLQQQYTQQSRLQQHQMLQPQMFQAPMYQHQMPPRIQQPHVHNKTRIMQQQYGALYGFGGQNKQYGTIVQGRTGTTNATTPRKTNSAAPSTSMQRMPYLNQWGQIMGYYMVKPRDSTQADMKTVEKKNAIKKVEDKAPAPTNENSFSEHPLMGTVQIAKNVQAQVARRVSSVNRTPVTEMKRGESSTRTVQVPKEQYGIKGIKALVPIPETPLQSEVSTEADSRGTCGACQQIVLNSQERVFSEGNYFHQDCFNTLLQAVQKSKTQIRNKAQTTSAPTSDPTKTVRISKDEFKAIPNQSEPDDILESNPWADDGSEVRGCCAACQKPVTTAMHRTCVDGVYYHNECFASMEEAFNKAKVQGKARYSSAVSQRVPAIIVESPSPRKTPGGTLRQLDEGDDWSPVPMEKLKWEVSPPLPTGVSRGECGVCSSIVYSSQERCRGDDGNYLHLACFDRVTANIKGLDPA